MSAWQSYDICFWSQKGLSLLGLCFSEKHCILLNFMSELAGKAPTAVTKVEINSVVKKFSEVHSRNDKYSWKGFKKNCTKNTVY